MRRRISIAALVGLALVYLAGTTLLQIDTTTVLPGLGNHSLAGQRGKPKDLPRPSLVPVRHLPLVRTVTLAPAIPVLGSFPTLIAEPVRIIADPVFGPLDTHACSTITPRAPPALA
jgi:hypothetical protein